MTRFIYGAGGGAQVMATTGGVPLTAPATVYTARTGGSTVTDILNLAGGALAGVVTPDSRGQVAFQGPDAMVSPLWLDFGDGGPRWVVEPADLEAAITAKRAALMLGEANTPSGFTAKSQLPFTTGNITAPLTTALDGKIAQRFASSAARDAAIPSPVDGDMIYNQAQHGLQLWNSGLGRWSAVPMILSDGFALTSTSNSVTLSGLIQNWKHMRIVWYGRAVGSLAAQSIFNQVRFQINTDTGTNYGFMGRAQRMKWVANVPTAEVAEDGTGGTAGTAGVLPTTTATYATLNNIFSAGAASAHVGYVPGSSAPASEWGMGMIDIPAYSAFGAGQKAFTMSSGFGNAAGVAGTGYQCNFQASGGWANTSNNIAAITLFLGGSATWATNSYFGVYGF